MFEPYNPPAPEFRPCELTKSCDYCNEEIEVDEPCVELFMGVLGRSKKAGFLMVVDASTVNPEKAVTLHNRCVAPWCFDNVDDAAEDYFKTANECPNCQAKVDPRICPHCGCQVD